MTATTVVCGDQLTRTAVQVRPLHSKEVHNLAERTFTRGVGWKYETVCGDTFGNVDHPAVLTTAEATCLHCLPTFPAVR